MIELGGADLWKGAREHGCKLASWLPKAAHARRDLKAFHPGKF